MILEGAVLSSPTREEEDVSSFSSPFESAKVEENKDGVIMDLNPEKYEKAKDYLFFDFFSLYTKNFITGGKQSKKRQLSAN